MDIPHKNETIEQIVELAFDVKGFPKNETTLDMVDVYVNANLIEKEFWHLTRPGKDADILIAVVPRGGETFRQVVLLGLVLAAGYYLGPLGALATVYIGTKVLIKPPEQGMTPQSFGDYSGSQMFQITAQQNQLTKYGNVPRVYGTHRVFPKIAANSYTELEADPVTNEISQYFYAIYDFGYGPLRIQDLKIGDTPIENFSQIEYNQVDINRPTVSEGEWDDIHKSEFTIYKGRNNLSDISASIDKNQNTPGAAVEEYQVIRNAAVNPEGLDQEIVLSFVCPRGLISFFTSGAANPVTIQLKVEFAEVGTEDWRPFDDLNYVKDYYDPFDEERLKISPVVFNAGFPTDLRNLVREIDTNQVYDAFGNPAGLDLDFLEPGGTPRNEFQFRYHRYGNTPIGISTKLPLSEFQPIGTRIWWNGEYFGTVTGHEAIGGGDSYHVMDIPKPFANFRYVDVGRYVDIGGGIYILQSLYFRNYKGTVPPHPDIEGVSGDSGLRINVFGAGGTQIAGQQTSPVFATIKFKPITTNQIKVRVTRLSTNTITTFNIQSDLVWSSINTRFDTLPIKTTNRHTFLELRIKATDQLNGTLQNLSGVASSYLDVYNGSTWEKQLTSNPAWILSDLLTGEINKRAISKDRLDITSIVEWANYCDTIPDPPPAYGAYYFERFQCNFVLDYATTLQRQIEQVCSAAQASLNLFNGKYGVLIDKNKDTPVQVFTIRNTQSFSSNRAYSDLPHAFDVKYVEPGANWEVRTVRSYFDGYDIDNATEFDEIDTFGCTNNEQAWRYGRYMQAQFTLRQENISIQVDFENIICTRGDYVIVAMDSMKAGGTPARIKKIVGNRITIDQDFITQPLINYGYTVRKVNGIFTSTMTIVSINEADVDGEIPAVGDLILWGEVGKINYDCIVKSITPGPDLTATINLVEKNDAIFDAESTDVIPTYDPLISEIGDLELTAPGPVQNLAIDEVGYDCDGSQYIYFIDLSWEPPLSGVYETFEIYVDYGQGYDLVTVIKSTSYQYVVSEINLGKLHKFKVIAVNSIGVKIDLGEAVSVSATPTSKITPPSDVEALFINVTSEGIQLDWEPVEDCDVEYYYLRYNKKLDASWNNSIPLIKVSPTTNKVTVQARVGSYFIKAVDFNGNESVVAAEAITSIPALINLNIIEEIDDAPGFAGNKDKIVKFGDAIILQEMVSGGPGYEQYWPEGEYFYTNLLDLGEIYTVRLQALIDAEGFTIDDLMVNWTTLAEVETLSSVGSSDWDVEVYVRGTDAHNVIAEWPTMAAINPISEGVQTNWTDWRKIENGDFTARIFQFKMNLKSFKSNVSPRVFDAIIRADMPDRDEADQNILSNAGSTKQITYSAPFAGPGTTPNIQISIDNAQTGDYWALINRTLAGFEIEIFDSTNTSVQRQFDWYAKGYGRKSNSVI